MITALGVLALTLTVQPESEKTPRTGRVEPFEHVVVDFDTRSVEVEGFVPIDVSHENTPDVWIELIAEAHGVRDFEALIGLHAEAREVHAALMLLGLEPGSPGKIIVQEDEEGRPLKRIDPTGPEIEVRFRYEQDGETITADPTTWVHDPETGKVFSELKPRFYFGGSSFREFEGKEWYMARVEGTVVGLCTFGNERGGTETIGCTPVLSPHSDMGDPVWHAINDKIPPFDTPMTLILRAIETEPDESDTNERQTQDAEDASESAISEPI